MGGVTASEDAYRRSHRYSTLLFDLAVARTTCVGFTCALSSSPLSLWPSSSNRIFSISALRVRVKISGLIPLYTSGLLRSTPPAITNNMYSRLRCIPQLLLLVLLSLSYLIHHAYANYEIPSDASEIVKCVGTRGTLCISGIPTIGPKNVSGITFTLSSYRYSGYLAIGLGRTSMNGAKIYAVWRDPKSPNGYRLGVRRGLNHNLAEYPKLSPKNEARLVPTPARATLSDSTSSSSTNITRPAFVASFWRPLRVTDDPSDIAIPANGTLSYIWSVGRDMPTPPTSPSAVLTQHVQMGSFDLDFTQPEPVPSTLISWDQDTNTGSYCVDDKLTFCVHIGLDIAKGVSTFTLQTVYDGWIGVGIGSSFMRNASLYLAWPGYGFGEVITSQRRVNSSSSPNSPPIIVPNTEVDYTLVQPPETIEILEATQLNVTFSRPINASVNPIQTNGLTRFIWAVASFGPDPAEGSRATVYQHSFKGTFELDLSPAGLANGVGAGAAVDE
ncbi:hypothetical protein HDV05_007092, partial [Chytridiales sp. JEL 0842]